MNTPNSNEENPVTPPPTRRQMEVERLRVEANGQHAPARLNFFTLRENLIANHINQGLVRISDPAANPSSTPNR
jgi:hypothetical protein